MWASRSRSLGRRVGVAAIVGAVLGLGLLSGGGATAQENGSPAGGDVLFAECLSRPNDAPQLAFWRAECDRVAAEAGYLAGVWRPTESKIDGAVSAPGKCTIYSAKWVCAGVPSEEAGSPTP